MAMAHPIDPSFGRAGSYSTGKSAVDAFRQGSYNTPRSVYHDEHSQPLNFWQKFMRSADTIRDALGDRCCRCLHHMPSLVLIIGILLLIGLTIAAVPVVFILISNQNAAQQTADGNLPHGAGAVFHPIRSGLDTVWPSFDEGNTDVEGVKIDKIRAISTAALFPRNVSLCHGFGFACTSQPSKVISTLARCDGKADCADGSDEQDCRECQTPFWCELPAAGAGKARARLCLRAEHLCNGVPDCPDDIDEKAFCHNKNIPCDLGTRRCKDTPLCLPESTVCDGEPDCRFGDDEIDCKQCSRGAKMCAPSGRCVPKSQVCDGVAHCSDGSDEVDCDCKSCSGSGRVLCSNGRCLERSKVCDGTIDCEGGLDEQDCPGTCHANASGTTAASVMAASVKTILCKDARHYPESEACSGRVRACARSCAACDAKHAFTCADGLCIRKMEVCDGNNDCAGGEDERGCDDACSRPHFKCAASGKCIAQASRCDGVSDCEDGSDEKDCEKCPAGSLRCETDARCFPAVARCDGVADCSDSSDEANCSCQECTGAHTDTYACEASNHCFKRETVCSPYSACPNATKADKLFCAAKALQLSRLF